MSAQYDQLIYDTAIKQGFSPTAAKFVVAQARFESADYTSNVFKANNNTSGMKYIGQSLATRGTLAPKNERSATCQAGGACRDSDHYAKFRSIQDSANDKIVRLYSITKGGVTPSQLKSAKTPEEFANLLKRRGYYGDSESVYANGLKAKLLRIQVVEFVTKNRNVLLLGAGLIILAYYVYKNKI
jgi:uncharacterized FlgJ-related protein